MAERLTLARPYAQAAFDVARGRGALSEWSSALRTAAAVVADEQIAPLLNHPAVEDATLVELVGETVARWDAAAGEVLAGAQGRNFLRVLADNERLGLLREISTVFDELKDAEEDCVDVEVVSAVGLDDRAREALVAALQRRLGHRVRLTCSVDPGLIGGVVIKASDLVIDGSVRHRLDRLTHSLVRA